jgi:hypothetical protein
MLFSPDPRLNFLGHLLKNVTLPATSIGAFALWAFA